MKKNSKNLVYISLLLWLVSLGDSMILFRGHNQKLAVDCIFLGFGVMLVVFLYDRYFHQNKS